VRRKFLLSVLLKNEGQHEALVENECIFKGKTYLQILAQTNFFIKKSRLSETDKKRFEN